VAHWESHRPRDPDAIPARVVRDPCQVCPLARMLGTILREPPPSGEMRWETATRGLGGSEPGQRPTGPPVDGARQLTTVADRLDFTDDEDLDGMAVSPGAAADRRSHLAGTPPEARI